MLMRRISALILALILVLAFAFPVFAHPGRTDANGGHWNKSTGEYHYHHGYPEHQHYDIDGDGITDCPYTDKSKKSQSSISTPAPVYTVKIQPETIPQKQAEPMDEPKPQAKAVAAETNGSKTISREDGYTAVFIFVGLFFVVMQFCNISEKNNLEATIHDIKSSYHELSIERFELKTQLDVARNELADNCVKLHENRSTIDQMRIDMDAQLETNNKLNSEVSELKKSLDAVSLSLRGANQKALSLENKLNTADAKNVQLSAENAELKSLLANIGSIVGNDVVCEAKAKPEVHLPIGVTIHNRVPIKGQPTSAKPFGDYTVYVSNKSHVYHKDPACCYSWKAPKHLYSLTDSYRKCSRCCMTDLPPEEDREWYKDITAALMKLDEGNGYYIR